MRQSFGQSTREVKTNSQDSSNSMNLTTLLPSDSSLPDALASLALMLSLSVAWWITGRALKARDNLSEQVARRWTANVRNALILIALVGLLMIWAPQLRTFALSVTAVAVAIVIATKELLLCISGSAFRTFTRAYTIGDIVQIGDHRGEVLDISLLSTQMQETDNREGSIRSTNRTVMVPHSLLFSQPARVLAKNENSAEHKFSLVFETESNLFALRKELESLAAEALAENLGLGSQSATGTPTISLQTTDLGRVRVEVSIRTSPRAAEQSESAITEALGSFVFSRPKRNGSKKSSTD